MMGVDPSWRVDPDGRRRVGSIKVFRVWKVRTSLQVEPEDRQSTGKEGPVHCRGYTSALAASSGS